MTHYMSTDVESRPTFTCAEPEDAACHIWADCLSTDGCESGDPDCKHERVQHDHCILSEWYAHPEDAASMYMDEHGDYDVTPPANVESARIVTEWDECPLWSFEDHVNRDQEDIEASIAGDTPWDRNHTNASEA